MSMSQVSPARRAQRGMTLVEVLVTLVLISVGLLGVAALQLTSLRNTQESYVRSQAAILAADLLDRMRANQTGFRAGDYDAPNFDDLGRAGTLGAVDLTAWQATLDRLLPGGAAAAAGRITRVNNVVTITIRWRERAEQANARSYDPANQPQFQTRSEI